MLWWEAILRGLGVYFGLLILLRVLGKRALAQLSAFEFLFFLLLGQAARPALLGPQPSTATGLILIATLVSIDYLLAILKSRIPALNKLLEGVPVTLVENGKLLIMNLKKSNVDCEDILSEARVRQGLESFDQIKLALLEKDGRISIVPKDKT